MTEQMACINSRPGRRGMLRSRDGAWRKLVPRAGSKKRESLAFAVWVHDTGCDVTMELQLAGRPITTWCENFEKKP